MRTNIVTAEFRGGQTARTQPVYQYDYGQILTFPDLTLPATYEVHFAKGTQNSTTVIGDENGVKVPDALLQRSGMLTAYIYLHTGNEDGETVYIIDIPVVQRAPIGSEQPDPVEIDAIAQAISALTSAVEETRENVLTATHAAEAAQTAAEVASATAVVVTATDIEGGHRVTVTDSDGETAFDVMDGAKGDAFTYADFTAEQKAELVQGPILDAQTAAVGAVTSAGAAQIQAAEEAVQDMIDGLPDYQQLEEDVSDLTSNKADKSDTVLLTTLSRGRRPNTTIGQASFAFGEGLIASGNYSHAEGGGTNASGNYSHAEGGGTNASGNYSHAEGGGTTASGSISHAEGSGSQARGVSSHAEGTYTIATHANQHVIGRYNATDPSPAASTASGTYVEIVGNGDYNTRSNARTLDWSGNESLAGDLTIRAGSANAKSVSSLVGEVSDLSDDLSDLSNALRDKLNAPSTAGTSGQVLTSDGQGGQSWQTPTNPLPSGGTTGQVLTKASDADGDADWQTPSDGAVQDVQVNGVSVLQDGVANVPKADINNLGVVRINNSYGIAVGSNGVLSTNPAGSAFIKAGTASYYPITPMRQHASVFYGLAKAAGSDEKNSTLPVGQYTESAKSAISEMLNGSVSVSGTTPTINALPGVRYVCGEVSTLDIVTPASGIVDVVFTSGSTPTVLTVTPPSGMIMKWANGFDPSALEADTVYEINVMDGCLGVAASWT